ncbi:hypothetical protein Shal_3444 [Shewanella halifaxensis HAW-EB4]|uniref:Uncharacterized protein n=1 Tax=Shewanella halifaxensis (strain HAW-EB4) TaxID=458817 RepID=B0TSN6_SHEHH|nr:hypothetical protein Shal_3444 [Shewanella halifaxensis HAW-EB4]
MGESKHKITNWSQYNKALVNRGSPAFWIDEQAIKSCRCTENTMVVVVEGIFIPMLL